MSFYMVLPSNSCPRSRPDNNASYYLVDYENAISLKDDNWEVAMTEFVFNYCPQTIRKGSKIKYKTKELHQIEEVIQLSLTNGNLEISNVLSNGKYGWYIYLEEKKLLLKTDCQVEVEFNSIDDAKKFGFNFINTKNKNNAFFSIIESDEPLMFENTPQISLKLKFSLIEDGGGGGVKEVEDNISLEIKNGKVQILKKKVSDVEISIDGKTKKMIIKSNYDMLLIEFNSLSDAQLLGFISQKKKNKPIDSIIASDVEISLNDIVKTDVKLKFKEIKEEIKYFEFDDDLMVNDLNSLVESFIKTCYKIFKEFVIDSKFGLVQFKLLDTVEYVSFDENLALILGLSTAKFYKSKEQVKGLHRPLLLGGIRQLYIYSSVVDPILVGDVRVPLLRSIWVDSNKHSFGDVVHVRLDNPMYLPVSSSSINKIEVNIRDDFGRLIKFPYGSKTSLTLHFRKYKQI